MMEAFENEEDIVAEESADEMIAGDEHPADTDRPRNPNQYSTLPTNPVTLENDGTATTGPGPSRLCMRILSALSIALAIDVVVLMAYIYQKEPPSFIAGIASSTGTTSSDTTQPAQNGIQWLPLPDESTVLTRVAFGSCSSQRMPLPYWDTLITDYRPELVLLMGDNVYGDCDEETCEVLRQAYVDMGNHPSVQGAAQHLPVMAVLDDHDYGGDDCHVDNPYKEIARELFADFFQLKNLPDDGVYQSATFGPPGQRLRIILTDTRYTRSPFVYARDDDPGGGPYTPPPDDDEMEHRQMMSDKQWEWLEKQLLEEPATVDLTLIVSTIQVLNDFSGEEGWRHIPKERKRLYDLIRDKPVVLLSGDRHMGGFYETEDGLIKEVTASAWTHSVPLSLMEDETGCDSAETCDEPDPRRIGPQVRENHFGSIEIDWEHKNFTLSLRRAESTYGITYQEDHRHKGSDAGEILMSRDYSFA
jgi:alkaline phosphatase D